MKTGHMRSGDIRRRELIGLEVEVVGSTCPAHLSVRGRVVDETRNTLVVEQDGAEKVLPKECCEFLFGHGSSSFRRSLPRSAGA